MIIITPSSSTIQCEASLFGIQEWKDKFKKYRDDICFIIMELRSCSRKWSYHICIFFNVSWMKFISASSSLTCSIEHQFSSVVILKALIVTIITVVFLYVYFKWNYHKHLILTLAIIHTSYYCYYLCIVDSDVKTWSIIGPHW